MRLWREPWRLSFRRGARSVRGCPTACRGTLGGLTGPPTNKRQGVARKKGPCFGQETVARKKGPLSVGMAVARGRASPSDPREICRGKNMRAFFLGRLFPGGLRSGRRDAPLGTAGRLDPFFLGISRSEGGVARWGLSRPPDQSLRLEAKKMLPRP